mmetsp:Transcript_99034/g.263158  ORF Transcript_99034/g.263158 Transcript_99034/m.263158 type:complete len:326 (+) Transcript_99034:267-1244(+)
MPRLRGTEAEAATASAPKLRSATAPEHRSQRGAPRDQEGQGGQGRRAACRRPRGPGLASVDAAVLVDATPQLQELLLRLCEPRLHVVQLFVLRLEGLEGSVVPGLRLPQLRPCLDLFLPEGRLLLTGALLHILGLLVFGLNLLHLLMKFLKLCLRFSQLLLALLDVVQLLLHALGRVGDADLINGAVAVLRLVQVSRFEAVFCCFGLVHLRLRLGLVLAERLFRLSFLLIKLLLVGPLSLQCLTRLLLLSSDPPLVRFQLLHPRAKAVILHLVMPLPVVRVLVLDKVLVVCVRLLDHRVRVVEVLLQRRRGLEVVRVVMAKKVRV